MVKIVQLITQQRTSSKIVGVQLSNAKAGCLAKAPEKVHLEGLL
jgi:hypothetical protein